MGEGSGDIIIKGGSVAVNFDDTLYRKDPADPQRHENANRKITKITIVDANKNSIYDSGDDPSGLNWTVTVSTR
jgi:hypothetical protein